MSTTASITDFKANVSSYLRQVTTGKEISITHHGKIRARVIPVGKTQNDARDFLKKAKVMRLHLQKNSKKDSWSLRENINFGRK